MLGKDFGQKYIELTDHKDNLEYCIGALENLNNQWQTEKAIKVLKSELGEIQHEINKMDVIKLNH